MELKGKHVVVTGGASGIGRALCVRFAADGAAVVVADFAEDGAVRPRNRSPMAADAPRQSRVTSATRNRCRTSSRRQRARSVRSTSSARTRGSDRWAASTPTMTRGSARWRPTSSRTCTRCVRCCRRCSNAVRAISCTLRPRRGCSHSSATFRTPSPSTPWSRWRSGCRSPTATPASASAASARRA